MRKKTNQPDVRRLIAAGRNASQIAKELNISADAVRQMAHRHGLNLIRATSDFWNDARREIVRQAVADKFTANDCAQTIGHGCTRNMVLSAARRMGLVFGGNMTDEAKSARARKGIVTKMALGQKIGPPSRTRRIGPKPPKPVPLAGMSWGDKASPVAVPPTKYVHPMAQFDEATVLPLQLAAHHCKWPVGEPGALDFGHCGAVQTPGKPYCPAHCARAFSATPPRHRTGNELHRSLRRFA